MKDAFKDPVLLYRATDAMQAAFLVMELENAGLRTHRTGGEASLTFGELGADALMVDLSVDQRDIEAGRALIEKLQDRLTQERKSEQPEWTCACGEVCEGTFESCWSCGAARI